MYRCKPADNDPVFDLAVTCKHRGIRHDHMVSHHTIMRHMGERHQKTVASDFGVPPFARAAVERGVFPNHRSVSDLKRGRLVGVFQILRRVSHDRPVVDMALPAEAGTYSDQGVRIDDGAVADLYIVLNDGERSDANAVSKLSLRADLRTRIDTCTHGILCF